MVGVKDVCTALLMVASVGLMLSASALDSRLVALQVGVLAGAQLLMTGLFTLLPTIFRANPSLMAFEVVGTAVVLYLACVGAPVVLGQLRDSER
jgi:hypothetical protein